MTKYRQERSRTTSRNKFKFGRRLVLTSWMLDHRPACGTPVTDDVRPGFYMEKRGAGVLIILDESGKFSGEKPTCRFIDDSEFLLTIYSARMERVDDD